MPKADQLDHSSRWLHRLARAGFRLLSGSNPSPSWQDWIEADNLLLRKEPSPPPAGPVVVDHYIGGLYCGGAERQLCNLAVAWKQRGQRVRVWTSWPPEGDLGHYRDLLVDGGVPVRAAGREASSERSSPLLLQTPETVQGLVAALCSELVQDRPDLLHCWMDHANIIGGLAGLLAGVPRILLSFRAANPTHFPRFHQPHMLPWYRLLLRSHRIDLLANSRPAAASYAAWLGWPVDRIHVVGNGLRLDHFAAPTALQRAAARQALGLTEEDRVVVGLLRLHEEKQPELFLDVVRRAAQRISGLRVLLAGVGPLEERVRSIIERERLDFVRLLGRWPEPGQLLAAADVLLLTSAQESCPNAVIEAQALGVPVVATRAGGMDEALLDGRSGFLAGIRDAEQLADYLVLLLEDRGLRRRLGAAGRQFAVETFNLDRMVRSMTQVYGQMLNAA